MFSRAIRTLSFTFIELVAVVALVSILVSLLLPVMDESRIKAKRTACQGNLKSLVQSLAAYQRDNDGTIAVGWDGSVANSAERTFWTKLKPYYGADTIRVCPANPLDKLLCYGLYGPLGGRDMASYVPNPAGTVYLGENTQLAYDAVSCHIDNWERDSAGDWELGYAVGYTSDAPTTNWSMRRPINPFVHRPLVNLAFCDGHVEAMHYSKAWGAPYRHGDPANIWDNQ